MYSRRPCRKIKGTHTWGANLQMQCQRVLRGLPKQRTPHEMKRTEHRGLERQKIVKPEPLDHLLEMDNFIFSCTLGLHHW